MTIPPQTDRDIDLRPQKDDYSANGIEIDEIDLRDEIAIDNKSTKPELGFKKPVPIWKNKKRILAIMVLIFFTLIYSEQGLYATDILPGIKIGGIGFGTKSKSDAKELLEKTSDKVTSTPFTLELEDKSISVSSQDLNLKYNNSKTIDAAYKKQKAYLPTSVVTSFFSRRLGMSNIVPTYTVDKNKLKAVSLNISNELSSGRVDAEVIITGTKVSVNEPVAGEGISRTDVEKVLLNQIETFSNEKVKLPKKNVEAKITSKEANAVANKVKNIFSSNVSITIPNGNILTITPEQMSSAISIINNQTSLKINIDETKLRASIADQLLKVEVKPVDATFAVNGTSVTVINSTAGQKVDMRSTIKSIINGNHSINALLVDDLPKHDTKWAQSLNITEQVSTFTTSFTPGQIRVKNIARAAEVVNNTVIEPNKTFSLNETLGKRTAENGYFKAPVYSADDGFTEDFGGGASQFSTTMFNASWIGGYKDMQHVPHSIYISRYPKGREATLNYGTIDLRIQNDYKSGILVKTYVSNSSVTVTFYGNKEGREVILEGPNTLSEKPVEKEITEDPTLAAGKEIQSDKGYPGSTVENIRIIKRPGKPDKVDRLVWTYSMVKSKVRLGTKPTEPAAPVAPVAPVG